MKYRWLVPAGFAAAALIMAGCGSSGSTHTAVAPASGANTVKTATIGGTTVLTNSKGLTLYWFAPDTSTTSQCNGSCAKFWPPVKGPATLAAGVHGTLGTITRSDGSSQATFDGHPLYTYIGDSGPGQATGNGLNAQGGVWHEVTTSAVAPASSPTKTGSGGGYGY
jgi:predicted lipoprotein with Yx(FWY)xxD motif